MHKLFLPFGNVDNFRKKKLKSMSGSHSVKTCRACRKQFKPANPAFEFCSKDCAAKLQNAVTAAPVKLVVPPSTVIEQRCAPVKGPQKVLIASATLDLIREILIHREWSNIRRNFCTTLKCWKFFPKLGPKKEEHFERKLWEMLAKWILCQTARQSSLEAKTTEPDEPTTFFPKEIKTYDEQLLRDVSILLEFRSHDTVKALHSLLETHNLGLKCRKAWLKVVEGLPNTRILRMENTTLDRAHSADDSSQTIQGTASNLELEFEYTCGGTLKKEKLGVAVPLPTYQKLYMAYQHNTDDEEDEFLKRYATVLIRYLRTLSSGSVQLCADTELKQSFVRSHQYCVVDLCASPINAFWVPTLGPEYFFFCSAFYDIDYHFGSIGSIFDPRAVDYLKGRLFDTSESPNWIFTLDIPYDEDFAESFFGKYFFEDNFLLKLREDTYFEDKNISFIAVLPHWWDLRFKMTGRSGPKAEDVGTYGHNHGPEVVWTWVETFVQCPDVTYHAFIPKSNYVYYSSETNSAMPNVVDTEVFSLELRARSGAGVHATRISDVLESTYGARRPPLGTLTPQS